MLLLIYINGSISQLKTTFETYIFVIPLCFSSLMAIIVGPIFVGPTGRRGTLKQYCPG